MAKITLIIDFDCEGFDELTEEEKLNTIDTVLESGAESTNSEIKTIFSRVEN